MDERERFEETTRTANLTIELDLTKTQYDSYQKVRTDDFWVLWQARTEIAKYDEKELIEALTELVKVISHLDMFTDVDWEKEDIIKLIEKHTGKTWE